MNEEQVRNLLETRLQQERATMQSQLEALSLRAQLAEREAAVAKEMLTTVSVGRQSAARTDEMAQLRSIVDVKLLEKLEVFSGADTAWDSWLTGFEALTGLIGLDEVMSIASSGYVSLEGCRLTALGADDARLKAKALRHLLTQACRGKARNLVKQAEKFNGAQAWKFLFGLTSQVVSMQC